jgi:hypothetical protein
LIRHNPYNMHAMKIIATGGGVAALFAAISESTIPGGSPLVDLLSTFGVLGVLIWYLWYVTAKDRPRTEQRHAESLLRLSVAHDTAVDKLATAHRAAVEVLSGAHERAVDRLVTEFRQEYADQRKVHLETVGHVVGQMEKQNETVLRLMENCSAMQARDKALQIEKA